MRRLLLARHHAAARGIAGIVCAILIGVAASVLPVRAAQHDNDIEWLGLSHVSWQDRRPSCPVSGESFQVRFQSYHDDLTAARVKLVAPSPATIDAAIIGRRGPYDIWAAQVPATAATIESYTLELVDGSDTDYLSTVGVTDGPPAAGNEFTLNFTTLEHAPLGATLATGGTVFRVWAPNASTANVRGEFNGWGLANPMTKVGEYFVAFVPGALDRKQYKYFFNGAVWQPDARGRQLNPSSSYNTYVDNPFRYGWGDSAYATPVLGQLIVYQLHVGTFAGRNDPVGSTPFPSRYVDVAARISYLKELGVNAVMLNPITEFPGDLNAGYDPVSQWAPESKYGSPDDLRYLIDFLHRNGIAVLLDIVWNHTSSTDNHLWNYDGSQIYYDVPQVETPWGSQTDFDRAAVRDYYVHSALQWLEEFHVDGFRMDATSYMNLYQGAGWGLMQRLNSDVDQRWSDKHVIAEQLPDDAGVTRPVSLGGAGFDSQYHDAFVDNLRQEIFDAAAGDPEMWKIRDLVNGGGAYLSDRYVTNYVELHDEAWPPGGQRLVKSIDTTAPHDDALAKGRTKLAQGLTLTAPGVPAFLMGTEWLEDTDFGTSSGNRIDWSKKSSYAPIFAYYKKLVGLRRASPALWADAPHVVTFVDEAQNLIGFRRYSGLRQLLVIANFSNADRLDYRVGLPMAGAWTEVLNSQAAAYDGIGIENPGAIATEAVTAHGFAQSAPIDIPRMGLLILAGPGAPVAVDDRAELRGDRILRVTPSPARGPALVEFELARAGETRIAVCDVAGRRMATLVDRSLPAGVQSVRWEGRDASGSLVRPGVYFVRLETARGADARRIARVF